MFTVFVTGPLASGKRSACQYLTTRGFRHIDMDDMAKELLDEEAVQRQLVELYGQDIMDEAAGIINRAKLAERAFVNEASTEGLNSIIWPLVGAKLSDFLVGNRCQAGCADNKIVVEIAMLAEAPGMTDLADTILGITAEPHIRIERALARGMQHDDITKRMALQASDEERAAICNIVIENNGSIEQLHAKLDVWLELQQQEQLF